MEMHEKRNKLQGGRVAGDPPLPTLPAAAGREKGSLQELFQPSGLCIIHGRGPGMVEQEWWWLGGNNCPHPHWEHGVGKSRILVKIRRWGVKLEDGNGVAVTWAASAPASCGHLLVKAFRLPCQNHSPGKVFTQVRGWGS